MTKVSDVLESDFVFRIILNTKATGVSHPPIFIPLSVKDDHGHPARYLLKTVLGTLTLLGEQFPDLKSALQKKSESSVNKPSQLEAEQLQLPT